jgi:type II secretory pathway predicted ATPase ExeA
MFEDFYQLSTNPFRLAPDPDFCFSHCGYKSAREYLEYALEQGEGFVMVTGRPGTGKTMLVETFLREIDNSRVIAKRIAVSNYGADELLRAMAYAYDIDAAELDKATLRHLIQQYFLQQEQAGRRVLLIMDEAQALQHSALEELRILADLQTESRTMLQLFLVGQESLQELMSTPEMEQFQQRVIANYHLLPLNLPETRAYIEYRLLRAGWSGDPEFASEAVASIYQLSKGVPRHINKICNRLLLLGFGKGSYIFDQEDVQAISAEMHEELLTPMESGTTLLADADSISDIPEIRDGVVALADLVIRIDKVDAHAFALSEASRRAARQKAQFVARHHDDSATWFPHESLPAEPPEDPVVIKTEQVSSPASPAPDDHHNGSAIAERLLSRLRFRETLVVTVATLAITTISIAALPSLFGQAPVTEALSEAHAPAGDDVIAVPDNTALLGSKPQSVQQPLPVATVNEDSSSQPQRQLRFVASFQTPGGVETPDEAVVAGDASAKAQATSRDGLMLATQQHADVDFQSASGAIIRDPLAQQGPAETAALLQPVAFGAGVADVMQDTKIAQLILLGQQSIADYRLLTPEEDNAYGYFLAVLRRDPDNADARAGIQEIVDIYVTLVRKAVNRRDNDRAGRYIDRALSIQPNNRALLALKDDLDSNISRSSSNSARRVSASQGDGRTIQESMMSRITTFFNKRKAEAKKGEVDVPAGWDS